jgi:hypothetical protein
VTDSRAPLPLLRQEPLTLEMMMPHPPRTLFTGARVLTAALAVALAGLGCSGSIDHGAGPGPGGNMNPGPGGNMNPGPGGNMNPGPVGNMNPGPGGNMNPGPGGVTPPAPAGVSAGVSPLRRLSNEQYRNSVRDLLGLQTAADTVPVTALPPDESIGDKFVSNVVRPVQGADLDRYADVAGQLAKKAVMNLGALVPCNPAQGNADCARAFITSFGRRAFRRPLAQVEVQRLEKVFTGGGAFDNGIRLVIEAILQSPKFLYLIEPAPADSSGKVMGLDSWSMAARLSYFLWNSTPDETLLQVADKGELATPDQLVVQARRLMADNRFKDTVATFHQAWLDLSELVGAEKDAKVFPLWNDQLKALMAEETRRFVEHVLKEGDGKLETLLGAKFTFLSGALYDVYGVPKPAGAAANEWRRVDLKAGERSGLLTHPSLMSALAREDRTSFVRRGKMVREALFCQEVPPPPPGVNDTEVNLPATASAKERAAAHRTAPDCAACHALFDPIGFAFETFDGIGRYRTMEAGKPVESQVQLTNTSIDGSYPDAVALGAKLGGAADVRACVAKQWLRYALGREDVDDDRPSLDGALRSFGDAGGSLPELLLGVIRSDSFRHQRVQ